MDKNQTVLRWQFLITATIACLLALGSACLAGGADQSLIARTRSKLYTNPGESLAILEDAIRRNPDEVAYWVEYIDALGNRSLADRACTHALKLHPRHPDLLIARARSYFGNSGVALDVLAELAKVPGYERQAERLKDLATCGLWMPKTEPWPPEMYTHLADRLLVLGRGGDAVRYIDEGLHLDAGEYAQPLLARRAMLAALNGEFKRAMKLHVSAGGAQEVMEDSYYGLADVLLEKNKPDLAIASLGRRVPTDENFRRVLAMAKSRSNDADGALKLLGPDEMEDRLLRCRVLLSAGRVEKAKTLGREIVAPMKSPQRSRTWIHYVGGGPRPLLDDYRSIIRWLNKQFTEKRLAIESELGRGTEDLPITPAYWSPAEPISRTIARLEAEIRKPTAAATLESVRAELSRNHAIIGRYNEAANLLTSSKPTDDRGAVNYAWAQWSMLRRQAEAQAASDKDYASLAAARPIIGRATNGQSRMRDAEVVKRLVAIGPAVLADVMTELQPNTISGNDRRVWVAVIERLGSAPDAPVLISTLTVVTRPERHPYPYQDENDRLSAAAIEKSLEKLTGAKPEGRDRATAWSKWWTENYVHIRAGNSPEPRHGRN